MAEVINQLFQWVGKRRRSANVFLKITYVVLLVLVIVSLASVIPAIPGFEWLKDLFAKAPPQVQTAVLSVLGVLGVVATAWGLQRNSRVIEVKDENARLKVQLSAAEEEIRHYQDRMDHLLDVEARAGLWQRPCQVAVPQFVPAHQRKTRFLTVVNLKGGVGKTTLTANLAACLALSAKPLRVLLIDIDFQGTLGNAVVEQSQIENQRKYSSFINRLLTTQEPDEELIQQLKVPMQGIGGANVVLATDTLDTDEFQLQARFFVCSGPPFLDRGDR